MAKIKVNDVWLIEELDIKEGVFNAYQRLLSEAGDWHLEGLSFNSLESSESRNVDDPFSKEEVFMALSSLCGDTATGPDGFSLAFWYHCRDFVKHEMMGLLKSSMSQAPSNKVLMLPL